MQFTLVLVSQIMQYRPPQETVAVSKGIWTAGDFVPTVANGNSIEFDGVGVSAGAWFDQATPNFGAFGEDEAQQMYWTNTEASKIQRANLDGSNVEDLVTGLGKPYGIALACFQHQLRSY